VPEVQRGAVRPGGPVHVKPVDDPEEVLEEMYRGADA
jgi:hypothetical protein